MATPALLNSRSTPGCCAVTACGSAATASRSATSSLAADAHPCRSHHLRRLGEPRLVDIGQRQMTLPLRQRQRDPRPMPLPAPVMRAVRLARVMRLDMFVRS